MRFKQFLEEEAHKFSCVIFFLPAKDAQYVIDWSKENIDDSMLFTDEEKGRENEVHITVFYGLHTNSSEDVLPIVKQFESAKVRFGSISKFESENCDVLKIDVDGSILRDMNKSLKELDFTSDFPTYRPHCTLAYVKKGSCDHLLKDTYFSGWETTVKEVVFSPAEGEKVKLPLK